MDNLIDRLAGMDLVLALVSFGVLTLTVALLVLGRTRWGQIQTLRKCLALSVLAHLLLIIYTTTVQIVTPVTPKPSKPVTRVVILEGETLKQPSPAEKAVRERPWKSLENNSVLQPAPIEVPRAEVTVTNEPPRTSQAPEPGSTAAVVLQKPPKTTFAEAAPVATIDTDQATASRVDPAATPLPKPEHTAPETAPSAPTLDAPLSRTVTEATLARPERVVRSGHESSLLDQPAPLPRMRDTADTTDLAEALPDSIEAPSSPAQGTLVPWQPADPAEPTPESNPHTAVARRETLAPAGRFQPSSLHADATRAMSKTLASMEAGALLTGPKLLEPKRTTPSEREVPEIYRLRLAPDRSRLAQRHGATPETEEAVKSALAWLARNQEKDGRWDAARHGAGRELLVAGRDRRSAGIDADTGVTGLALLAFLASGHTHETGKYRETVRRGLDFLIDSQEPNGSLGGQAATFARMYCHGMASFALSEAYGMTGDPQLRKPVLQAIAYTIDAQDTVSGGWRYNPGEVGDTSQFGWQLMALKSAELAGIPTPDNVMEHAGRYLGSVSFGNYGGLSAYRSVERTSRPMTAEALVCRQFLGHSPYSPPCREAGGDLLLELPGEGEPNFYYWYYGTLGMYQLGGIYWQRWNEALQPALLGRQRTDGEMTGSWDDDTMWGGYGGRVFTTALATLSLEVYYRFLPLYVEAAGRDTTNPIR